MEKQKDGDSTEQMNAKRANDTFKLPQKSHTVRQSSVNAAAHVSAEEK